MSDIRMISEKAADRYEAEIRTLTQQRDELAAALESANAALQLTLTDVTALGPYILMPATKDILTATSVIAQAGVNVSREGGNNLW